MASRRLRRPEDSMPPAVREKLVTSRLPPVETTQSSALRAILSHRFHYGVLLLFHFFYSIYLRLRLIYHTLVNKIYSMVYYHHRTPELIKRDVQNLARLPGHLSVALELENGDKVAGLDTLIDDMAEIIAWCASAGIFTVSVYEKTGILKGYVSASHRAASQRLQAYFGKNRPSLRIRVPHSTSYADGDHYATTDGESDMEVIFISEEDGREALVDLTKTLCEMRQRGKINPEDVSVDLVDTELTDSGFTEPDLLILFSPYVKLSGYPPWQIRLTEIFHVQDNDGVGYHVFLRALHRFAKTEFRFGR